MSLLLREHLPPVRALFAALATDEERAHFAVALADGFERYNRACDGTLVAGADYLEIVAVKA